MEDSVRWEAERIRALEAASHLADLLSGHADFERLVDGYLETKRTLAEAFRDISSAHMSQIPAIENARIAIEARMASLKGKIPSRFLRTRSYSTVHEVLCSYMVLHAGSSVSATRLRALTGDQVHTERRLRELRELGFDITVHKVAGDTHYLMSGPEPDLSLGIRSQLALNIRAARDLEQSEKDALLSSLE